MSGAFLTDDLAAFFDADEFADEAIFDGNPGVAPVLGIFDRNFDLAQLGGADVASTAPVFVLATADVPDNVRSRYLRFGNLLAGGSRYRVANVHDDGTGVTLLQLHEA
jgi:hypothetical protein